MRWMNQILADGESWTRRPVLINPDHIVMVAGVELNDFEGSAVKVWLDVVLDGDMADMMVAHSMTEMQDTLTP